MRISAVANVIGITMLNLVLSGCVTARDPVVVSNAALKPIGNWRVERQIDRITGAPITSAFLTARSSHSSAPYPLQAVIQLSCFKGDPLVRFGFDVKVGSNRNSEFMYRFDTKPGREGEARFLQNFRNVVIEDKDEVVHFLKEMSKSELLYIRIRSLNAGRTSAEFRLNGAETAIETAIGDCLPAPTRRTRTAAG